MMEINIIAVGKIKEDYIKSGIEDFIKRLIHIIKLNIIELDDEKIPTNISKSLIKQIKEKEGERILARIPNNTYIIVLDSRGKPTTSEGLAKSIQNLQLRGNSSITFIIGGALGLSRSVKEAGDYILSFSYMTFTHQMIRLFLIEQVYRAFKIIRGEPYHL
jgi:23S rRNA (pseudouridine1915-N3)-methyltransferase